MLKRSDYKPGDPIYTFVDNDGTNTHIDSKRLRDWTIAQTDLEIQLCPVHEHKAIEMLRNNCVLMSRVLQLAEECVLGTRKLDPVIFCKTHTQTNGRPDVMLVDGHHRYVMCARFRLDYIPCHILEISQWTPFQIEGCIDIDQDTLRHLPVNGNRNY